MYNFTGEPLLSGMCSASGHHADRRVADRRALRRAWSRPTRRHFACQRDGIWLSAIGLLLFVTGFVLFLQWTGRADVKHANVEDLGWANAGDKFLMIGAGLLR